MLEGGEGPGREGEGREGKGVIKAESCYPEVVDGGMCFFVQVR